MTKRIAKIVASRSHVDYVGRVVDRLDAEGAPGAEDYGFAQFVRLPVGAGEEVVGVIYDTQLVNPEYGNFGPRLSPPSELSILSPDYLNEQGVFVGVLLLGWRDLGGTHHAVPRRVMPVGQEVYAMPGEEVLAFHRDGAGRLRLHYFSQVVSHAGAFALPLLEAVLEQLEAGASVEERQRFCVLRKSLAWQRTMGGVRL
ncbi:MAG TPA: hypothetical protein VM864_01820 [Pyrinomonadaceae bacterium]|jgi:hypothetical protein|nr:hypothetical protein [Pyrinomonadaceae bacterium]